MYSALFHKADEGGFWVSFPDFPECLTQGTSLWNAYEMARDDVRVLASYFGCEIVTGGNHSQKVVHKSSGTVIPIPMHGNCIGEAYVKELKNLFDQIKGE